MKTIKKFFEAFASNDLHAGMQIGRFVPYGDGQKKAFKILGGERHLDNIIREYKEDDVYFQFGTHIFFDRKAKISDIIAKNGGFIDVDIRRNHQELTGEILSDEALTEKIDIIKEKIANHEYLKDWYCIINSGNGCHIWYIGDRIKVDESFTAEVYRDAMTTLYDEYKQLIIDDPSLYPDYSCTSVEKLARVPGTYNISRKDYGLEPIQSNILYFQGVKSIIFTL